MKKLVPGLSAISAILLFAISVPAIAGEHDLLNAKKVPPPSLSFVENKGQVTNQDGKPRNDIDFKLATSDVIVFAGSGALHYQWNKAEAAPRTGAKKQAVTTQSYRMDVVLLGANKNAEVITAEKQEYLETYYMPQYNGSVSAYNRVAYKNIYPNIDWVLYSKDGQVKYDFVVHPGGDPKQIKLQYNGATSLKMKDGGVIAETPYGNITEQKPYSYNASTKQEIASSFVVSENILSFDIATNTTTHDIVIDPLLDWSTYYGGTNYDAAIDVAADASGNAYMCGSTISSSNIATTGSYQVTFGGFEDAFLVKFNITGTRQWATYYGGIEYDNFVDIEIDGSNNIYVAGETGSSSGIASSGAHQTAFGANFNYDIYLVKFNASGARQWATYYGGGGHDIWASVATDASGNVYLAGETSSTSAIATSGAYKTAITGAQDGFLAKFNSSGVRQWGTYFGGTAHDRFYNLACDPSGNIYACGETQSTSGIATTGAHQTAHGTGTWDGMIAKFAGAGTLTWATYYGGSGADRVNGVSCDASGNVYFGGTTGSTFGIATTGSYQATLNNTGSGSNTDGYLAKFNASGVRQWATYFGGGGNDRVLDIAVDGVNNKIFLSGHTESTNRISTGISSYQVFLNGGSDLFMCNFDNNGLLEYGTYLGGNGLEYENGSGLTINSGKLYIAGGTYSSIGIANGNAYQSTLAGNADGFLASVIITSTVFINQPFNDTLFCSGASFNLPYTVIGFFYAGNVFTAQLSDANGSFDAPVTLGTLAATGSGVIACTIPANTPTGGGYRIRIAASAPAGYSGNNGKNIGIGKGPIVTPVATTNAPICAGSTLNLLAATSTLGVTYSWTGPNGYASDAQNPTRVNGDVPMSGDYIVKTTLYGCPEQKDTVTVLVKPMPASPTAGSNSPVCETKNINLTASSVTPGVSYSWSGPNAYVGSVQNPVLTPATMAMAGTYTVTADLNGCMLTATTNVQVKTMPAMPTVGSNSPLCAGSDLNLTSASTTPGVTYSWAGPGSYTSSAQNPTRTSATVAMSGIYTVTANLSGCTQADAINVVVKPMPANPTAGSNTPLCEGSTINLTSGTATPGVSYSWAGPNSFASNAQNPTIPNSTSGMSGSYTVTIDLNGCVQNAMTDVVVSPKPANVNATGDANICAGNSINLDVTSSSPGASFSWTGPSGFTFAGASTTITNATTARSGTYTATATLNGCSVTDNVTVTVRTSPAMPVLGSNGPICSGSTLNLTSTTITGVMYDWSGPSGYTSNAQNPTIPGATTANSGIYTLTVTNGSNCSQVASINAVVNSFPDMPSVNSNSPVCDGEDLFLTSFTPTTGVSYSWTGPGGFVSAQQNPARFNVSTAATGTYTVTVTRNGCSRSRTASVVVNPVPVITNISSNSPVCINTTMTLFAQSDVSGASYSWIGPNGFFSSVQNPVLNNVPANNAGVYSVTATIGGCTSAVATTSVSVGINTPTPVVSNDGPICIGSNLQLQASSIPGAVYSWTGPNGFTSNLQNPMLTNVQTINGGNYTVSADVNGCVSLPATTSVTINPASFVNIYATPNDTICNGTPVTFMSLAINPGTSPVYRWYKNNIQVPGATGSNYTDPSPVNGDDYLCVMSNTADCGVSHADSSSRVRMQVLQKTTPGVVIIADQDKLFSPYQWVTFTAVAADAGDNPVYQWKKNGQDVIGANAATWSTANLKNEDTITVVVTSDYLCSDPGMIESNKIGIVMTTGVEEKTALTGIELYPNPNSGNFTVGGTVPATGAIRIEVQNAVGQVVYRSTVETNGTGWNIPVTLPDIANGIYLMRLYAGGQETAIRFTINK